jgi:alanine racemase
MMERLPYRSWLEVSRQQLGDNFLSITKIVGPDVEVMPVVKADAYRHGAVEVSRVLEQRGARWLAVSNTEEGVVLRDAGIRTRILVMADFLPFTREALLAYELTPVIQSLEDVIELNRIARSRETRYSCHLKIDSGMGRLGVKPDAAAIIETMQQAPHVELEGVMTHSHRRATISRIRPKNRSQCLTMSYSRSLPRARGRGMCTCRARSPLRTGAKRHGEEWCGPDTRFTDMYRRPAAMRRQRPCK